jgi:hypothetical protein
MGRSFVIATAVVVCSAPLAARADETHGYCYYVKGVAAAETALMVSPVLFATVGRIDQSSIVMTPDPTTPDIRYTAGVSYRLTGIVEGIFNTRRANAECRRHEALAQVQGESTYHALAARARVLDEALAEAGKMLARANAELERRTATAQDVMSTRVRVDELRAMAASTKLELEALPAPSPQTPLVRALGSLYSADADLERQEARLREIKAFDVSVRVGYDTYLGLDDASPLFAVLSISFSPGWLAQRGANSRAASGRRHLVQEEYGTHQVDTTTTRLKAMLAVEAKRETETGALVDVLGEQLEQLRKIGGDGSRRLYETVWFEWIKARAEHEYLVSHVQALAEILGEDAK